MTGIWQFHRMGGATSRMGGATSFPYLALPSRFKSLLNAPWTVQGLWKWGQMLERLCEAHTLGRNIGVEWDWQLSRAGTMHFIGPSCWFFFCLLSLLEVGIVGLGSLD